MRAIGLVSAVLALLLAGTAWSGPKSNTRTYTTGQFVVNCTSTGQVCSPAKKLRVMPPRSGTVTSVRYSTAATHCSALVLQVVKANGQVIAHSKRIEAGDQTEQFTTDIHVPKGGKTLRFRAKGFVGGCNVGSVASWGGKITVTVKLKG
jgi:hypothetical protein